MIVKLLPVGPEVLRAYGKICALRNYIGPTQEPMAGVFIGADGVLVSGAVLSPIDSRFVLLSHFVTNPQTPLRLRHMAAHDTVQFAQTFATLASRQLIVPPNIPRSLAPFLRRRGFRDDPQCMWWPPGLMNVLKAKAPQAPLPKGPQPRVATTPAAVITPKKKGKSKK